jgi:signal transduction histidine kinase
VTVANGIKFFDSKGFVDHILDRFLTGWKRYLLGAAMVGLGYLISRVLGNLLDVEVYLLPFVSILMASIFGGLGPGFLATLLATAASRQLVPKQDSGDVWRLLIEGTLVSLVGGSLRQERMRVREHLATNLRLEREILHISDEERRRIGHDLHDRLGQQLTGISLLTETFAQHLVAGEKPDRDKLETITRLISEAVEPLPNYPGTRRFGPGDPGTRRDDIVDVRYPMRL